MGEDPASKTIGLLLMGGPPPDWVFAVIKDYRLPVRKSII
jgi:hypothetical protein